MKHKNGGKSKRRNQTIRVLIADDHAILRDGLKALLSGEHDIEVVGEASTGKEALKLTRQLKPDVILMDIAMPEMTGLEATEIIHKSYPEVKIIALTVHEHETYFRRMLQSGARGYVVKRVVADELTQAIRTVAKGDIYIHHDIAKKFLEEISYLGKQRPTKLSDREWQVLRLIALGYTNQQIADRLALSVKTVETYRSRIADKLHLQTRSELVKFAIQQGLLDEEVI